MFLYFVESEDNCIAPMKHHYHFVQNVRKIFVNFMAVEGK